MDKPTKRPSRKFSWTPYLSMYLSVFVGIHIYLTTQQFTANREEQSYLLDAQRNEPLIVFDGKPHLDDIDFKVVELHNQEEMDEFPNLPGPVRLHPIPVYEERIFGNLRVKNISSTVAMVRTIVLCDTNTTRPFMRERLLSGSLKTDSSFEFRWAHNLVPGQIDSFDISWLISRPSDHGNFILHFLVNYTNPAGFVFDTYFWMEYGPKGVLQSDIGLKHSVSRLPDGRFVFTHWQRTMPVDSILILKNIKQEFHVYTREEAMVFYKELDSMKTLPSREK